MNSETKIALVIFCVLVALIACSYLFWQHKENTRPLLHEVRIVTATQNDPVFREGPRRLQPGEQVDIAAAIRFGEPEGESIWMCPATHLEIDDERVEHLASAEWPEKDRTVRVIWFTVESTFLGGDLQPDTLDEQLEYRSYLAPEMGRGMIAEAFPESHNGDYLGTAANATDIDAGILRLYARAEIVESESDIQALQSVSSAGVENVEDAGFPALIRRHDFPDPINDDVSEYFLLPCWNDGTPDTPPDRELNLEIEARVHDKLLITPENLARIATSGDLKSSFAPLRSMRISEQHLLDHGRPLVFGKNLEIGDILRQEKRWFVVLADDGDSKLGLTDSVLTCWRSPAQVVDLGSVIDTTMTTVTHLRASQSKDHPTAQ